MTTLDSSVRLVSLQFSFSNPNHVGKTIKEIERETVEEQVSRKQREKTPSAGVQVIEGVEDTSLSQFLDNLEASGYEMVDAIYQPRPHPRNPHVTYYMVRFLFARKEYVNLSEHFAKVRSTIREELASMATAAMWRVRAYLNPFFKDGEAVDGQHALSLNFEVRKSLLLPDGSPVVQWEKDEDGERVGDAPLPIQPEFQLLLENDTISVVPFSTDQ